jgi:hypothetical protein
VPADGTAPIPGDYLAYPQPSAAAPAIIQAPKNQDLFLGGTVVQYVVAEGVAPLSYQWQINQQDIPEATGRILRIADARAAQAGAYRVRVSNPLGRLHSTPAMVTVQAFGLRNQIFQGVPFIPSILLEACSMIRGSPMNRL